MSLPIKAIYENGVFRPLSSIALSEGQFVQIIVLVVDGEKSDPAFNLVELAEETGIADLATNIDHYLYGLPKQSDEQVIR